MDELLNDFDDPCYACYEDYLPGTPELAYKIIAGHSCILKRGLDHESLFFIRRLLENLNENTLPGIGKPYTCFSVSYLHALLHGLESTREKYSVARLEQWLEYLQHFNDTTGLSLRMGTEEEVLVYARQCFDLNENHPIEWGKLFALKGNAFVVVDVYSEISQKTVPGDGTFADILLVCDPKTSVF